MMNSPWAMLMTPATPKMTARPTAAMMRMATTLRPLMNCVVSAAAFSMGQLRVMRMQGAVRPQLRGRTTFPRELQVDRARLVWIVALQPLHDLGIGEVAVLVRIKQVDPGIGPDPVIGLPDDVELALLVRLADPRPQPGVVVL